MDVNICTWDCPESCTSCWDEAVVTMVTKGPAGDVTYDVCIDGKIHATGYPGKALRIRECEAEEEPPEAGPVTLGPISVWPPVAHRTRQGLKRRRQPCASPVSRTEANLHPPRQEILLPAARQRCR